VIFHANRQQSFTHATYFQVLGNVAQALHLDAGMRSPWRTLDYSEDAVPLFLRRLPESRARVVFAHAPPRRARFREVPSVIVDHDATDDSPEVRLARLLRRLPTHRRDEHEVRTPRIALGAFLLSVFFVSVLSASAALVAARWIGPAPTATELLGIP
jgi:hypothetical protein